MKAALVLVSLCFVLGLGALGLFYFSGREAPNEQRAANSSSSSLAPGQSTTPTTASDGRSDEVAARMDAFAREIDDLRAQVAALKSGAAREPAVEAAPQKVVDEPTASFAAAHREAILKVIDEDRQEQKRKADDEQRARDLQTALARAERTAKDFGLAGNQQKALADVYILERQKMDDLRNQMRDQGGAGGDPQAMRQSFRDLRDWRLNELTNRLGADLAEKINEADFQRFGGGFGSGGRRGQGGQGGQGGGNGGTDGGNRPGGF